MKPIRTWTAQIFTGLREGYAGPLHAIEDVRRICRGFVDAAKLCVTITPTEFIYVNGEEPGVIVGLINYPRFPLSSADLEDRAFALAALLKKELGQLRVTIVFPNQTVTLGDQ